jgi:hypothetical protein
MSATQVEIKTFRLSNRLSVTLSVSRAGITAEWHPDLPSKGLTRSEVKHYRRARDEMLPRLAQQLGGVVVLIDDNMIGVAE